MNFLKNELVWDDLDRIYQYRNNGEVVNLYGEQLWYKGRCLHLGHRPRLLELITVFFQGSKNNRNISELIGEIIKERTGGSSSERYQRSLKLQTLKNIQRLRMLLEETFTLDSRSAWFPHDRRSKTWVLIGEQKSRALFEKRAKRRVDIS